MGGAHPFCGQGQADELLFKVDDRASEDWRVLADELMNVSAGELVIRLKQVPEFFKWIGAHGEVFISFSWKKKSPGSELARAFTKLFPTAPVGSRGARWLARERLVEIR